LVTCAETTRAAAEQQQLNEGIGLRALFSWAELLTDRIDPEHAFEDAILNSVPDEERETLRQQCLLAYDRTRVAEALDPQGHLTTGNPPDPTAANPTGGGRNAAGDFDPVDC